MKNIKVALLGLGNIGTGFYKTMETQRENFKYKVGANLEIKKILEKDIDREFSEYIDRELLTENWEEILNDDEIEIIVELIGGTHIAKKFVKEALEKGKSVITANKDMVAEFGSELFEIAGRKNTDFLFEAAVGGGIPIIRPLKQCLAGNELEEVLGIVNGTTNYILTKMTQEKWSFEEALKKAQELGYAESDPTADIEGLDAARKVAILASLAFNSKVTFKEVYVEGISKITPSDIKYADEFGYVIKLIGLTRKNEKGVEARVHPILIPKEHPLASVNDSFNAIFVKGDAIGEAMFLGYGAGQMPTASAVIGDVIEAARNIVTDCKGRISCTCYKEDKPVEMDEVRTKFFLRLAVENKPGVLSSISGVFGENDVSINSVIQKNCNRDNAELVIITDVVREQDFNNAIKQIKEMEILKEVSGLIRVYANV